MAKFEGENLNVFRAWANRYMADQWAERGMPPSIHRRMMANFDLCDSPIERKMLAGLMFCPFGYYDELNQVVAASDWRGASMHNDSAVIIPQITIGRLKWRVDFMVSLGTKADDIRPLIFVIECDGHDFHERTKEQAAKDRKRDRDLQWLGVPILRFTGSEIFRDLDGCISQIDSFGAGLLEGAWKKHGKI